MSAKAVATRPNALSANRVALVTIAETTDAAVAAGIASKAKFVATASA